MENVRHNLCNLSEICVIILRMQIRRKRMKKKKKKKKYRKPAIRSEKIFETAALACGKCPSASQPVWMGSCPRAKYGT